MQQHLQKMENLALYLCICELERREEKRAIEQMGKLHS